MTSAGHSRLKAASLPLATIAAAGTMALILAVMAAPGVNVMADPAVPSSPDSDPPAAADFGRIEGTVQGSGLRYVGVSSCAAASCHGGTKADGRLHSAYSTWVQKDKHANAYTALFGADSKRIAKRLGDRREPHQIERCLDCHALNVPQDLLADKDRFTIEDGVTCEACHGPAGDWLGEHWKDEWKRLPPIEKERRGMRSTKCNLAARARVCVECHVGSGCKNVDHDLIAAGHPPLKFEFAAYLALMPPHWDDQADRFRFSLDFAGSCDSVPRNLGPARTQTSRSYADAKFWLVGQIVTAKASIELLKSRASQARSSWPEFAEYDCFACHHSLAAGSWRQNSGRLQPGGPAPQRRPGMYSYGSWYFSWLDAASDLGAAINSNDFASLPGSLAALSEEMSKSSPDRQATVNAVRRVAAQLGNIESRMNGLGRETFDKETVRRILKNRVQAGRDAAWRSWDAAAQNYLSIVPLRQSLEDLSGSDEIAHSKASSQAAETLVEISKKLEFDPCCNSPSEIDWPSRWKAVQKKLREISSGL